MRRLRLAGPVVYLEADIDTLAQRIAGAPLRGMACGPEMSFMDLFNERTPLYRRYADFTVSSGHDTADQIAANILDLLR